MTISYPVSFPSSPVTNSVTLICANGNSIGESPYTAKTQVYAYESDWWGVQVAWPVLTRAEAQIVMGFLASLRGRYGTFLYGPTYFGTPLGAATGTPLVNGGSQTGFTVVTDGWTPSTTILKAGDFFQIDQRLYMATQDATSNGSGQVTIDIWPSLRGHVDNSSIVVSNPKGIFRLLEDTVRLIDVPETELCSMSFDAKEAR